MDTTTSRPTHRRWILLVPAALVLMIVASCGGEASPAETRSLPPSQPVEAADVHDHEPIAAGRITVEDAGQIFEARGAVFIDVRAASAHEASHIPGAVSIPLEALTQPLEGLSPNTPIITYCT